MSILCVDDNQPFLISMVERLEVAGYQVDAATSPESALDSLTRNPFRYDVVITDMEFPGTKDGEQLVTEIIAFRETRGYDPAPEIICITGAKSKMTPELLQRMRERGCHYVLKGTDQYFIETQASMTNLQELRSNRPLFLFIHGASAGYSWGLTGHAGCQVGESVNEVHLLHAGLRRPIKMDPTPRRVFDFLAKRTSRRPYSVEEVANAMALDEFYNYWHGDEGTLSSDWVKNNVARIRNALRQAFSDAGLPLIPTDVLATEVFEDQGEVTIDGAHSKLFRSPIRVSSRDDLLPFSERSECYRFRGRALVEHIP
jgi:CheY-like chemotaxis protein